MIISHSELDYSNNNTMRQSNLVKYIKDGYEVYVESVYVVNGRKKKKVKKKKIS